MEKEKLVNKIKKYKINKYKSLFIASAIGVLPSLFREHKPLSYELPKEITAEIVVIGGDTISAKDFYENVNYSSENNSWNYSAKDKSHNVTYLFDYKITNNANMKKLNEKDIKNLNETAIITYKEKTIDLNTKPMNPNFHLNLFESLLEAQVSENPFFDFTPPQPPKQKTETSERNEFSPLVSKNIEIFYNLSQQREGLGVLAFYLENNNSITMMNMQADTTLSAEKRQKLQEILDTKYNREDIMFNYDHEYHHAINAKNGINKLGMSPEQMYLRRCHDELSANLKQFWKQRENYLKNGNDASKLPSQSKFYDDLVKQGKIKPSYDALVSEEEQKYIAEGMQKYWDNTFKSIYSPSTLRYIKNRIKNNPAYETAEGTKEYYRILNDAYTYEVNGQKINLYPFVKEFSIPYKDKVELGAIKRERGFIENDAISYLRETKGKKAMNDYIGDQKMKYMRKKDR